MTKTQGLFLLLGIWLAIGIPLVAGSMYLCKQKTGKWWR